MGLKRQVQNEIDRCLKRVAEAQADFQELWLKLEQMEKASVYSSSPQRHVDRNAVRYCRANATVLQHRICFI
jgi:hypothetical protein